MNTTTITRILALTTSAALLPFANAHHNAAPIYDFSKSVSIEGVVTDYQFVHPHARIYLEVRDESGAIQEWMAEGANAVALRYHGWTGEEVKPGDRITVTGAPSRNGSPRLEWREVVLPDGKVLGGGNNFRKEFEEQLSELERMRRERISQSE